MHRFILTLTALLLAQPVLAEDWRVLDDAGIIQALSARVLAYPNGASQDFFADGRTLYQVSTGDSWGKWWAEAGKYCSTWPPSNTPSCYALAVNGFDIRFSSSQEQETIGRYGDLN